MVIYSIGMIAISMVIVSIVIGRVVVINVGMYESLNGIPKRERNNNSITNKRQSVLVDVSSLKQK